MHEISDSLKSYKNQILDIVLKDKFAMNLYCQDKMDALEEYVLHNYDLTKE